MGDGHVSRYVVICGNTLNAFTDYLISKLGFIIIKTTANEGTLIVRPSDIIQITSYKSFWEGARISLKNGDDYFLNLENFSKLKFMLDILI